MKTLYPVSEETYARIGKAYLICANYPEVFGDVTYKKFCSMFVDVIEDDEDEREARMKVAAPEMYLILKEVRNWSTQFEMDMRIEAEIKDVLRAIDGEEEQS